jgi:hypothetical protein
LEQSALKAAIRQDHNQRNITQGQGGVTSKNTIFQDDSMVIPEEDLDETVIK